MFFADLIKWGLEQTQLIDTPKSSYPQTRSWSGPIHQSARAPEGMVWVSKRYDQEKPMMLFVTRVEDEALKSITAVGVTTDKDCVAVVNELGLRAGILLSRQAPAITERRRMNVVADIPSACASETMGFGKLGLLPRATGRLRFDQCLDSCLYKCA